MCNTYTTNIFITMIGKLPVFHASKILGDAFSGTFGEHLGCLKVERDTYYGQDNSFLIGQPTNNINLSQTTFELNFAYICKK